MSPFLASSFVKASPFFAESGALWSLSVAEALTLFLTMVLG